MSEAESVQENLLHELNAAMETWERASTEAYQAMAGQLTDLRERIDAFRQEAPAPAEADLAIADRDARIAGLEAECARLWNVEKRLEEALHECEELRREVARLQRSGHAEPPVQGAAEAFPGLDTLSVFDDEGQRKRLGEILLDTGLISEDQLDEALEWQRLQPHQRLGALMIERGYTNEEAIARIIAAQCHLSFEKLGENDVNPSVAGQIQAALARKRSCVPIRREGECVVLAMANPMDLIAIEDVERAMSSAVRPVVATPAAIDFTISRYCPET